MKKQNTRKIAIFSFFVFMLIAGLFLYQNSSQAKKNSRNRLTEANNTPKSQEQPTTELAKKSTETVISPDKAVIVSCKYPSQVLNLTGWKETLPTGSTKKPTEIKQATLASYSANPYFQANSSCDGVIFRAPVNGVTTSGSGYPRSELREMTTDGKSLASWATTSGTHSMFIDAAITAVPKTKKHIVVGQIHDANDDVIVIRLEYPKLFVDINGQTGPTLDPNYQLGKRFTVKFLASNGQISVYYNGNTTSSYTMKKSSSGNYFKAGAYTQSNCSKETDCSGNNFGEAILYKLSVQH
ncbi:MAG: Polyguluronate lyase [Parcubacteria group bacterium GW2011_GWD2_38_11]|nr:MAG: Polyguluronate lyase [Parcubacteria group bacterium GW2011_GWD2_38_11]